MPGRAARQLCRRLAIVCLGATLLYIAVAAVASIFPDVEQVEGARFWPAFLPDWPVDLLLALAAILLVGDALLWLVARSAARNERARLQKLASDWHLRSEAKAAAAGGDQALRLTAFRARPLPGGAQVSWAAPAGTYDRVLVLRSPRSFALAPGVAVGQAVAYEGVDSDFQDQGLDPDRVYLYTAFAEARGGAEWSAPDVRRWSPPAWTSVTTPPARLRDVTLRHIWTLDG
jgi:hypothetical protein